jgi:hypothetical protein
MPGNVHDLQNLTRAAWKPSGSSATYLTTEDSAGFLEGAYRNTSGRRPGRPTAFELPEQIETVDTINLVVSELLELSTSNRPGAAEIYQLYPRLIHAGGKVEPAGRTPN